MGHRDDSTSLYFVFVSTFWCFFFSSFDPFVLSLFCSMLHLQMGDESEPVITSRERAEHL